MALEMIGVQAVVEGYDTFMKNLRDMRGAIDDTEQSIGGASGRYDLGADSASRYAGAVDGATASSGKLLSASNVLSGAVGGALVLGIGAATSAIVNLTGKLKDFGIGAVFAASDAEETASKFSIVFGDNTERAINSLDELGDRIGRSTNDLKAFAAGFQDTLVPLGFARDGAADLSIGLTELTEDLASFNNLNTADVANALSSALVGNTENLRQFGVVATDATIKQRALELGYEAVNGQLSAQEKALTIIDLLYEQTSDAQGDATRTAEGFANKVRALEGDLTDTRIAIGGELLPIANRLLSLFSGLIPALSDVGVGFARSFGEIASPVLDRVEDNLPRIIDGIGRIGGVVNSIITPISNASKAIGGLFSGDETSPQRLIDSILGIDWVGIGSTVASLITNGFGALTNLSSQASGGLVNALISIDWKSVGLRVGEIFIGSVGVAIGLVGDIFGTALKNIAGSIGNYLKFGEVIRNSLLSIDFVSVGSSIGSSLSNAIDAGLATLSRIGSTAIETIQSINWLEAGSVIGQKITDGIKTTLNFVKNLLLGIQEVSDTAGPAIKNLVSTVASALITYTPIVVKAALDFGIGITNGILESITLDDRLIAGVSNLVSGIIAPFEDALNRFTGFVSSIKTSAETALNEAVQIATTTVTNIKDTVTRLTDEAKTAVTTKWTEIKTNVGDTLDETYTKVTTVMGDTKTAIDTKWTEIKTSIATSLSNIILQTIEKGIEFYNAGITLFTQFSSGLDSLAESVRLSFITPVETSLSSVLETATGWYDSGVTLLTSLKDGAVSIGESIKTAISGLIDDAKKAVSDAVGDFSSLGGDLVGGIASGITAKISEVVSAVKNVVQQALGAGKAEGEVRSPSKLFARELGVFIPEGIAMGIDLTSDVVGNSVVGAIKSAVTSATQIAKQPPPIQAQTSQPVAVQPINRVTNSAVSNNQRTVNVTFGDLVSNSPAQSQLLAKLVWNEISSNALGAT